jgi:hypothetical protein
VVDELDRHREIVVSQVKVAPGLGIREVPEVGNHEDKETEVGLGGDEHPVRVTICSPVPVAPLQRRGVIGGEGGRGVIGGGEPADGIEDDVADRVGEADTVAACADALDQLRNLNERKPARRLHIEFLDGFLDFVAVLDSGGAVGSTHLVVTGEPAPDLLPSPQGMELAGAFLHGEALSMKI